MPEKEGSAAVEARGRSSDQAADDLVRRFGARSRPARRLVPELHAAFARADRPHVREAVRHWREISLPLYGAAMERRDACSSLCRAFRLPEADPQRLLMAVQAYYVLVLKHILAVEIARPDAVTVALAQVFAGLESHPFAWPERLVDPEWESLLGQSAEGEEETAKVAAIVEDRFQALYHSLFPRPVRHALGQYFTPAWLVEHLMEQAGYDGEPGRRVLDPSCGSGAFLLAAIRRLRRRRSQDAVSGESGSDRRAATECIVGWDIDPLAVMTARANYLLAFSDAGCWSGPIPVHLHDAILGTPPHGSQECGRDGAFDLVAGNPPWIAWDHLLPAYREATRSLWQRYGLFSLTGAAARHGGGKKDLAMLMLYAVADRHLKDGGRLAMVLTQTALQTKGAGDGFRRFRLGDGAWLRVLRVDDLAGLNPFPGASNWTCTMLLEKGSPTVYPVPYFRWRARSGEDCESLCAEPVDAGHPSSPWLLRPSDEAGTQHPRIGPSDYLAHLGANSGGANGVYWLEVLGQEAQGVRVRNLADRGKRPVACVEQVVEPGLLYPLVRWSDVRRWRADSSLYILMAQDPYTRKGIAPDILQRNFPHTLRYLQHFEGPLRARSAFRRYQAKAPYWSMYDVGEYTLVPWKVIWRRMDRQISAAVAGPREDLRLGPRPAVPQETCVLIAADGRAEAHYLCAMLNSGPIDGLVRAHSVRGGKGFGTPTILQFLGIRRFDPERPEHAELVSLSEAAHHRTAEGKDSLAIQQRLDELVRVFF